MQPKHGKQAGINVERQIYSEGLTNDQRPSEGYKKGERKKETLDQ